MVAEITEFYIKQAAKDYLSRRCLCQDISPQRSSDYQNPEGPQEKIEKRGLAG